MPERFGLFTMIVLGESIVVLTSGVVETSWRPVSALPAMSVFTVAACLWWLYFDHVDDKAIGQSFTSGIAGVVRSHVWGYGHLAVWAGIATTSVGIELAISETSEPKLAAAIRWAMCGGISLYLLAISAIQLATPHRSAETSWPYASASPSSWPRSHLLALPETADARRAFGPVPGRVDGLRALAPSILRLSQERYRPISELLAGIPSRRLVAGSTPRETAQRLAAFLARGLGLRVLLAGVLRGAEVERRVQDQG